MPGSRRQTAALRGYRPLRGSRKRYPGGGSGLTDDTLVILSQSGQAFRGVGDVSLQYTETWITIDNSQLHGLTLAQEARQTSRQDHSSWNPNSKLRKNPVAFISAAAGEPLKPTAGCDDVPSNDRLNNRCGQMPALERGDNPALGGRVTDVPGQRELGETAQGTSNDYRASLPGEATPFFFDLTGQNADKRACEAFVDIPSLVSSPESSGDEVILFRGRNRSMQSMQISGSAQVLCTRAHTPKLHVDGKTPVDPQVLVIRPQPPAVVRTTQHSTRGRGRRNRRGLGGGHVHGNASDDSILDDYIANMLENGEMEEAVNPKPHGRRAQDDSRTCRVPKPKRLKGSPEARNEDCDCENPDASAGDEVAESIDTQSLDDTHSGESGAESEPDDETLAKLFAGQSLVDTGIGIGCNDQYQIDNASTDDARGHGSGPAQARKEFDFMDWERPSLQRKKGKKSRAKLPLAGCDSDIEQQLHAAWQNDRLKKKQLKKQREEIRVLGMLGQGTKPGDLRVKYPKGMNTVDVGQEMRTFLVSMHETLTFPPMDINARKMIHELANQFKVNSKSTGKADQRRTTIARTKRTKPYVESTFENAMGRIRRRQLPRPDAKRKRAPTKYTVAGSGHAATSYRDGDVVGEGAAELGAENRGRAMLEKMGWSRGTALGATHNKGILQPVTQTMKRSKAGLG